MKIIYQGDIHLRDRAPVNRVDDYFKAQFNKLEQLVNFANCEGAVLMLGGDIFDTHKVSAEVLNHAIDVLKECAQGVYACLGQHDVPYHQVDMIKSPVYALQAADALQVSPPTRKTFFGSDHCLTTCSWEEKPLESEDGCYNILLGHISVFEKELPFYWKSEGYTPKTLKEKYPGFDLYLCGDIHNPFVKDGVIVSGSMMRQSINQIDYLPRAYFIDTETGEIDTRYYTIEPDVFSVQGITADETSLDLESLVEAMKESAELKNSYKKDCITLAKDDEPVQKIIKEVFDELDD